jgi:hypothetical protein
MMSEKFSNQLFDLLVKYRDRVLVVVIAALLLSLGSLALSVRTEHSGLDSLWSYVGRPILTISVFLIIALNLSKISRRPLGR